MISVRTFGDTELRDAANNLLLMVDESGFQPDIVFSIAKGGTYVVEAMEEELKHRDIQVASILCQRPSTRTKESLGMRVWATKLPLSVRNGLRIVEHYLRIILDIVRVDPERSVAVRGPGDISDRDGLRILVIDDAADSGDTLLAVDEYLKGIFPTSNIRFGVVTQTRPRVSKVPDYSLYKSVLIRFPWSNDVHANDAPSEELSA